MNAHPDEVIQALYDSDTPAQRWPNVASALRRCLDSTTVRIMASCPRTNEIHIDALTLDWPEYLKQEYDAHYINTDPRIAAGMMNLGRTVSCIETIDQATFQKSALCDFLNRPDVDAQWSLLHLARSPWGHRLLFGACRPRKSQPFSQIEKDRLDAVLLPVKRALDLDARLASAAQQSKAFEATLDVLSDPVIVLTDTLRVVYVNARGEDLLAGNNGLRVIRGQLHAVRPADQTALERAVRGATSAEFGEALPASAITKTQDSFLVMRSFRLPRASSVATNDPSRQCALIITATAGHRMDDGPAAMPIVSA
jgi:PAS domain-containing protein